MTDPDNRLTAEIKAEARRRIEAGELPGWRLKDCAFSLIEALVFLALVAIFAGFVWLCFEHWQSSSVQSGVIVRKRYTPATVTTEYIAIDGASLPVSRPHPESWSVTVRGSNKDGRMRERTIYVDQTTYHRAQIGAEVSTNEL